MLRLASQAKIPAGKTSRAATRKQIEEDYTLMAELEAKYGAAALAPLLQEIKI
jgi:hypothetical protein